MSITKTNKRNYRKITSSMTVLASRKMEKISRKGVLCMKLKTLSNSCLRPFQLKQHLNYAHNDQVCRVIEYIESKKGCLKFV